ncbi:MAG: winged helix-turn-helix transcriptional regulator [Lachnospiraceae bacterium]|nr:winged helix-turn-helix transcriptional regulator [Lachnospiraceae bacterium]
MKHPEGQTVTEAFEEVYMKFKLHFYREIFGTFSSREATLTTVETFCMEVIYAMQCPTINEFASFIQISPPNAAYKVNSLIKKGYVEKIRSTKDKREYYLRPTQKYLDYYDISSSYLRQVLDRLTKRLPDEDQEKLQEILNIMSNELMQEVPEYKHLEKEADI